MVIPEPREHLKALIAENEGRRRNGPASDGRGWYRTAADRMDCFAIADAVMELFIDEITVEGRSPRSGVWWANAPRRDATRYVLRTHPEPVPVEET